jgi:FG-GAP repeat
MSTQSIAATAFLAIIAGTAMSAEPVLRSHVEISDDGRTVVERSLAPIGQADHSPAGSATAEVPFGTTPDLTVELRRQIGGLAIADMDGDGRNDIVAVCYSSNSFPPYEDWHDMIFFNSATGLETTPSWTSDEQTHTGDVQVGDVNGDSLNDVVAIHGGVRTDNVSIHFGLPGGGVETTASWTSSTSPNAWGTSGLLVDIDNDSDLDLVTTNQGLGVSSPTRPMFMFRNDGTGLETDPSWESAASEISNGLDARDITGDGFPDIAVAKWVNFSSGVYYNTTGTPDTFQSLFVPGTGAEKGAAFTDLGDDFSPDVAFGGDPTMVYTLVHGAILPLSETNPPFNGPQEVHFFDIDLDGDDDLGEVHFSDGRAHLYLNRDGVLDTDPSWTYDASEVGTSMALGDLNGDNRPDLVIGYSGDTCIRVFYGQAAACAPDLTGEGDLNFLDVSEFLAAFGMMDPVADFEADGDFNFLDVSAFLAAFAAGCP